MDPIISKISGGNGFPANLTNAVEPISTNREVYDTTKKFPQEIGSVIEKPIRNQEQQINELQKMIDAIQGPKRVLEVSVHQETNAIMVKVLNEQTGDVIREIPPERRLDVAAKMMELAGIIIDKKI